MICYKVESMYNNNWVDTYIPERLTLVGSLSYPEKVHSKTVFDWNNNVGIY